MKLFRRNKDNGEGQPILRNKAGGDSRSTLEDGLRDGNRLGRGDTTEVILKGYHSVIPTNGGYIGAGNYLLDSVTSEPISRGYHKLTPTEIPGVFEADLGASHYVLDANSRNSETGLAIVIEGRMGHAYLKAKIDGVTDSRELKERLDRFGGDNINITIPHSYSGGSNRGSGGSNTGSDGFVTGLIVGSLFD